MRKGWLSPKDPITVKLESREQSDVLRRDAQQHNYLLRELYCNWKIIDLFLPKYFPAMTGSKYILADMYEIVNSTSNPDAKFEFTRSIYPCVSYLVKKCWWKPCIGSFNKYTDWVHCWQITKAILGQKRFLEWSMSGFYLPQASFCVLRPPVRVIIEWSNISTGMLV